ncbi:cupin domain-containing protein [Modestobacter sp. VKM Ac-2978]|nr:cupin domain-containing protein [Modestobacter sp. VKM Ac-2978]
MRVIRDVVPAGTYGGNFSGEVSLAMLRAAADDSQPDVALVRFLEGATTHWHSHPGGQLFWVVEGRAVVGTKGDGAIELQPGTLIEAPGDESHWHGAAPGLDTTLLTITWGTTVWSANPAPSSPTMKEEP